jgi:hypothetical protein
VLPHCIDQEAFDDDVEGWNWELAFLAVIAEVVFELGSEVWGFAVDLPQCRPEGGGAFPAVASGEYLVNRSEVKDPKAFSLFDGRDQLAGAGDGGEVHQGARHTCDRDAVLQGPVGVSERSRQVHGDALHHGLPLARNEHMDGAS